MAYLTGASHFENGGIKWGRGPEKLNPTISGLFEPQLSQKADKINFWQQITEMAKMRHRTALRAPEARQTEWPELSTTLHFNDIQ